jgi:exonuclease III
VVIRIYEDLVKSNGVIVYKARFVNNDSENEETRFCLDNFQVNVITKIKELFFKEQYINDEEDYKYESLSDTYGKSIINLCKKCVESFLDIKCSAIRSLTKRCLSKTCNGRFESVAKSSPKRRRHHRHQDIEPVKRINSKDDFWERKVKSMLIMLSNDVESNPGPPCKGPINIGNTSNLFVLTYNVQGLGNFNKLKRVINYFHKLPFKNNSIINLQETHLTSQNTIKYQWKHGSVQFFGKPNSCGVAILYNENFFDKILGNYSDDSGRFCTLIAEKDNETYLFVNCYAPNNHYESIEFFNMVENYITDINNAYQSINLFISGDLNVIFDKNVDSIGRRQTKQEEKVVGKIKRIKSLFGLKDSYRLLNTYGGFTWEKNNPSFLRSRLDYILASNNIISKLIISQTSNAICESDHSLLISEFQLNNVKYGPGIVRCNATLLDDTEVLEEVQKA